MSPPDVRAAPSFCPEVLAVEDHTLEAVGADVVRALVDHLREVLFVRDPRSNRMLYVNPVF